MRTVTTMVDVADLVETIAGSVAPLASERGLELTAHVAEGTGAIESDRLKLGQVLLNLLANAVKFTDSGSVKLTAHRDGDRAIFIVEDTGRGIAEQDLGRIFDEFYQVDDPDVGKTQGTGLGLSVSRRLMELLGGTLGVTSVVGAGTTFTVAIPASLVSAEHPAEDA